MTVTEDAATELAKFRWFMLSRRAVQLMRAGERVAAAYVAGDMRALRIETKGAIKDAKAGLTVARQIKSRDARWAPTCNAMLRAGELHEAALRRLPLRTGQRDFDEIGEQWSIALLEARALYLRLGGNPDEILSFKEMVR